MGGRVPVSDHDLPPSTLAYGTYVARALARRWPRTAGLVSSSWPAAFGFSSLMALPGPPCREPAADEYAAGTIWQFASSVVNPRAYCERGDSGDQHADFQ